MMDFIGTNFQGYRILEQLGSAGGANIFRAAPLKGDEVVAIKFLSPHIGRNRYLINQLRATFQNVTRLDHPFILKVKSFNVHKTYPYIVMPFLQAGSLEDRISLGALAVINVVSVIRNVALALQVIHSRGMVHGDLKPSNILFDDDGNVQLSGIGEAPLAGTRSDQYRNQGDFGSSYQAPEVFAGGKATQASDQYSLGLVALELHTSLPVNEALNALDYVQQNGRANITRPSPYALDLNARMLGFLTKALSPDPEGRFPTMKDWSRAYIQAFTNEQALSTAEFVRTRELRKKPRRNRLLLLAPILASILCLIFIVPGFSSMGKGAIGGILQSLGIFQDRDRSNAPFSDEWVGGIDLGTATPGRKNRDLQDLTSSATEDIPKPDGSDADEKKAPTNSPALPEKQKPIQDPFVTQLPQATTMSTLSFTATPVPINTLEVTATATTDLAETPAVTEDPSSATSEPEPTIKPRRCRSNPDKKNYCTPTPEP